MLNENLANELLQYKAKFLQVPANQHISKIVHGELFVLNYLYGKQSCGIHPKELSERMVVSTARISALLNHMEKQGLISRKADNFDNRQILVCITEKGKEYIEDKKYEVIKHIKDMLERIGLEDAKEYVRIHKKIVDIFCEK